jgi:hypothetical protein
MCFLEKDLELLFEEFLKSPDKNIFSLELKIEKEKLFFSSPTFKVFFSIDFSYTENKQKFSPIFHFPTIFNQVLEFCETKNPTLVEVVSLVVLIDFNKRLQNCGMRRR